MKKKLCYVVSAEMTAKSFLLPHIKGLQNEMDIFLIANTSNPGFMGSEVLALTVIPVSIARKPSLLQDVAALWRLFNLFRKYRFDIVHSVSPKAGLLAMLAARFSGVPRRFHTFTGQVWSTKKGVGRYILKSMDRILAACATDLLTDSPSQSAFIVGEGVVSKGKCSVIGEGSISGVNLKRFFQNGEVRSRLREELQFRPEECVFLYIGRMNREKGLFELAEAFESIVQRGHAAKLLLVGVDEENITQSIRKIHHVILPHITFISFTDKPEDYMNASDVLVLPSYREGFGNVVLEAAAVGIPAIGSDIYGLSDAICNGTTGILVKKGSAEALMDAMVELCQDAKKRSIFGIAARERAGQLFSEERITKGLREHYLS